MAPIAFYSWTPVPHNGNYFIHYVSASATYEQNDLKRLKKGLVELEYLLENWEKKTTYCNFGEFQRELLDAKNKEKLLAAAEEGN